MDHQIIRSLFRAFVLASRLLGVKGDLPVNAANILPRIAPNMKGQHGQLQEWLEDKDNPNNKHRHVSHLWGVHPGSDITWKDTEMLDAAIRSLAGNPCRIKYGEKSVLLDIIKGKKVILDKDLMITDHI
jgi:alpha-L-fucosidase 2